MKCKSVIVLTLVLITSGTLFLLLKFENQPINESIIQEDEDQRARFQYERARYEFDMVKDPATGKIPRGIYEAEMEQANTIRLRTSNNTNQTARLTALNTYHPAGPNNIGGRTRALAYDMRFNGTTNRVIIAGSVSGGIMRSTDGGANWTRVSPDNDIHNVTAVTQDPRPGFQDTWYAGSGENSGNSANEFGALYLGQYVWKSVNNGASWTRLPTNTIVDIPGNQPIGSSLEVFDHPFDFVHKIAINPVNGDVYISGHRRLLKSTNGGDTFQTVFGSIVGANSSNGQSDVVITNSGKLILGMNGGTPDVNLKGVWTSTTGNLASWTRIAGGSTLGVDSVADWRGNDYNSEGRRIILGLAPSNQNIAYICYENGLSNQSPDFKPEADLFKLDMTSGFSWTNLSANMPDFNEPINEPNGMPMSHPATDPFATQGGYNMQLTVKPNDPNFVILGGTSLYRSTNGFSSTANTKWIGGYGTSTTSNFLSLYPNSHPDMHNFAFNPSNVNEALSSNDGGIQRTLDISANISASTPVIWSMVSNYQTLQYNYVAIDPGLGRNNFMGGSHDNGTYLRDKMQLLGTAATDSNNHVRILGGDGGYAGMSRLSGNSQFLYTSFQLGNLRRFKSAATPVTDNITPDNLTPNPGSTGEFGDFVTNIRLDPDNTEDIYYVNFNRLFRTISASTVTASTWTELSTVSTTIDPNGSTDGFNSIRAMGFSRGPYLTSHVLYLGTTNGKIYRIDDPRNATSGIVPIDITPTGNTGNVQDIAVNPNNDDEVLAVVSNYGVISVWWTNNAKSAAPTWRNGEGNLTLPSFRSCMIVVKKDAANNPVTEYYVGTSVGLYSVAALGTTLLANAAPDWQREGGSTLNFSLVQSMAYRPGDNVLLVGTHGNGMYYTFTGTPNYTPNINTGINDPVLNDKNFIRLIYPNITANQVNYRIGNMFNVKHISIQLFNMSGQQVWQKEAGFQNGLVDISRYSRGAYILSIISDDRKYRHIQKIIKQ